MVKMNRYEKTKKASILGIIGNVFLFLIKGFFGLTSRSNALIADAANSASDIFASLMTLIGNKIASKPKDNDHNFGHGKSEYIFSFIISLSMALVSFKLLINSFNSILSKENLNFSYYLIIVCIITILVKLFLYIYTKSLNKKFNNILLKANSKDHLNDCFVTTFTLISLIFSYKQIYIIDSIVGIGIALWILYTSIRLFIESFNVLMDISIDKKTKNIILNLIHKYKEIKKIESFCSTPSGHKYIIILTICVDGNLSTFKSHELANNLEKNITLLDNVSNVIIHVNPL